MKSLEGQEIQTMRNSKKKFADSDMKSRVWRT